MNKAISAISEKLRRPFFVRGVPADGLVCRRERPRVERVNLIDRYGWCLRFLAIA